MRIASEDNTRLQGSHDFAGHKDAEKPAASYKLIISELGQKKKACFDFDF